MLIKDKLHNAVNTYHWATWAMAPFAESDIF